MVFTASEELDENNKEMIRETLVEQAWSVNYKYGGRWQLSTHSDQLSLSLLKYFLYMRDEKVYGLYYI